MSRIADFLKGIISLILIVALLAGIPALLLVIVGFPLPIEAPSWQLIRTHIEDGNIPDLFVVKTLAVVVWIVWIQLAVAVLTEVFALLRGRSSARAPVLPGIQQFAGKLVASTVLIVSALTPGRAATAAPIVPLDVAAAVMAPDQPGLIPSALPTGPGALTMTAGGPSSGEAGSQAARAAGRYTTKSGDNWWDMAERILGDGMRWSELRDLNQGKTMLTGEVISENTETVSGGWRLDVPVDANPGFLDGDLDLIGSDGERGSAAAIAPDNSDNDSSQNTAGVSGLLSAIRPYTLVYEGPTGADDPGPGVPYQVVEGDNLWDIAERHLGDPFRWPEIFENSNELRQSFGRKITDPNLIWPDSILWLPTDATGVPKADTELVLEVVGPVTPVTAERGDGLTQIQPEDIRAVADAARNNAADAARNNAADAARNTPTDPTDGDPDGSGGPGGRAAARSIEDANLDQPDIGIAERLAGPAGLAFGAGGALLATGLLGMLQRARRLRLAEAGAGSHPAPPPMELTDIETVLRNNADGERAHSIHGAIRSLTNRSVVVSEPLAAPEVIRVSGDRIEVVQRGADPELPIPWLVGKNPALDFLADRSLAVLPAEFFPDEPSDDPSQIAAPTCVTIGGGLMVNLEAIGVIGIDGPVELVAGLVRSMVHELATGPARRSIDILVSDWLPGAELHQHVRCGPLDNVMARLESWLEDAELSLTASGALSAYALRAGGMADSVPNATVVFADASDAVAIAPLVERAKRCALPLAVVLSGDLDGLASGPETMIRLDADTLRLEPHGFTAAMQYLDVDVVLGAEALIAHARQAPMMLRNDDSSAPGHLADHDTDPAQVATEETPEQDIATELPIEEHEITDQAEDADSGILIRVLGPVEIEGGPTDLTEAQQSLLAFLALVGPSTEQQIRDAVWPGETVDAEEFQHNIAHLRSTLGPRFPIVGDGRYRLRSVITDLGSARRWITQARSMSDDRARNLLQLALADVRGRPFSGVNERYWQWTADHKMALATQASSLLMDACFDLCDSAYQANDVYLAKWACGIGSLIDPLHETVVTRRAQLLQVLGLSEEAERVVGEWEARFTEAASRPAPRGPRLALANAEAMAPNVG